MPSTIADVISLMELHVEITEIQQRQLTDLTTQQFLGEEVNTILNTVAGMDAEVVLALRKSIEMFKKFQ
jgi:hypothetical protein